MEKSGRSESVAANRGKEWKSAHGRNARSGEDDEKAADMLRTRERIHGVPCWLFGSYATSLFTDFFSFSLP